MVLKWQSGIDKRFHLSIMKYELNCPKQLIFYSYVVWAGKTLIQEVWFGKYFA